MIQEYSKTIQAEQFKYGMEDGFETRYTSEEYPNITWGIPTSEDNIEVEIPYIITDEDHRQLINEGDYIIHLENGTKKIKQKNEFEKKYSLVN